MVLQAAVVRRALFIVLHEDGRIVGGHEGGGSVQVLVQVVLSLVGSLEDRDTRHRCWNISEQTDIQVKKPQVS